MKAVRDVPEEEDVYGPFTRLGMMDPNYGTELMFVSGKFQGKGGMYLEKLNVQHRVVVFAGPRERADLVRATWEHTFKLKGFDGEYYTFQQAEKDREDVANGRRQAAGLRPLGEGFVGRSRPVTPDREDQLVEKIKHAMEQLGINGPLPERVVTKVNRRRR